MINKNVRSCLLCGVGGQGTVLASRIIAAAAMAKGLSAKTAETIGMAQRGGSVVSHVRTGHHIASPMIPAGCADVLIGFEPGEALANLEAVRPDGTVIVCRREVKPITASLGQSAYDGETSLRYIQSKFPDCTVLDGDEICRACGSPKVLNVAVVGALCETGAMDITLEEAENAIRQRMKPALIDMNLKALHMGAAAVQAPAVR